eukprot:4580301-Amphidinium_carterae.2
MWLHLLPFSNIECPSTFRSLSPGVTWSLTSNLCCTHQVPSLRREDLRAAVGARRTENPENHPPQELLDTSEPGEPANARATEGIVQYWQYHHLLTHVWCKKGLGYLSFLTYLVQMMKCHGCYRHQEPTRSTLSSLVQLPCVSSARERPLGYELGVLPVWTGNVTGSMDSIGYESVCYADIEYADNMPGYRYVQTSPLYPLKERQQRQACTALTAPLTTTLDHVFG